MSNGRVFRHRGSGRNAFHTHKVGATAWARKFQQDLPHEEYGFQQAAARQMEHPVRPILRSLPDLSVSGLQSTIPYEEASVPQATDLEEELDEHGQGTRNPTWGRTTTEQY